MTVVDTNVCHIPLSETVTAVTPREIITVSDSSHYRMHGMAPECCIPSHHCSKISLELPAAEDGTSVQSFPKRNSQRRDIHNCITSIHAQAL